MSSNMVSKSLLWNSPFFRFLCDEWTSIPKIFFFCQQPQITKISSNGSPCQRSIQPQQPLLLASGRKPRGHAHFTCTQWKQLLQLEQSNEARALSSKNKIRFINGSLPPPQELDPLFESWERCNNTVVAWISRTLNAQIASSTISIDNAHELWNDLQRRFTKENHFRMSDLL